MQRLVCHESRVLHLVWVVERQAHELRLLYGRRFLTPRLWLTPLDWYTLLAGRQVELLWARRQHPPEVWLTLSRLRGQLLISTDKDLTYTACGPPPVPHQWPPLSFADFYRAAESERGEKPETGWSDVYEAQLEAKREEWGPA
jgi:hypothetical protein